ncbi:MAG: DUF3320 domain-containing protein [Nitrospirales bacterium]
MSAEILTRLEFARKELLDLGLRNPLLNHRIKSKQVRVVDELATEVFRLLVQEGQSMSFEALPEKKVSHVSALEDEDQTAGSVDWTNLLDQPENPHDGAGLAKRHVDKKLQTAMSSEKLQARLLSIHRDARTYLEEQGVNVLFLAIGFLHWYEIASSEEARHAPLILIPVELTRHSAQERFHISWTNEDIGDNYSLAGKLKNDFNLQLPTMGAVEDLDVPRYFDTVVSSLGEHSRRKVVPNEMVLGFFSFGKFLMYRDLNPESWPTGRGPNEHPVLSKLLGDGFREPDSPFGDEDHLDDHVAPADLHQVADSDSSQTLAILDIHSGRNLVLQGPPGTGKSQTITNMIAEAIGHNRKVLFVSEKMAALEVVKRRLDCLGLGDAVLELHSHKTNKKQVLDELNRTLELGRPQLTGGEGSLTALTHLRDHLNAYCTAVNSPIGRTNTPFIRALGHCHDFPSTNLFSFPNIADWTEADYREIRSVVHLLDQHLAEYGPPTKNPFYPCTLQDYLPSQRSSLEQAFQAAIRQTEAVSQGGLALAEAMGLVAPTTQRDVERLCHTAVHAAEAPSLKGICLHSDMWRTRGEDVQRLVDAGRRVLNMRERFEKWVIDQAWSQDLLDIRQAFLTHGDTWWRLLSGRFRQAQARLQGLCRRPLPKEAKKVLILIDGIMAYQASLQIYEELASVGQTLFGTQWKALQSDWNSLEQLTEWILAVHQDPDQHYLIPGFVDFLSREPQVGGLQEQAGSLKQLLESREAAIRDVVQRLALPPGNPLEMADNAPLDQQHHILQTWCQHLDGLQHLMQFKQLATELRKKNLAPFIEIALNWDQGAGTLLQAFDAHWYRSLVEHAYLEKAPLKCFDRIRHEQLIQDYRSLDTQVLQFNRQRLAYKHWENLPKMSTEGELNVIKREINKKRRHVPIRKLMDEAGRAVQAIKPVFMMSPISIATFIPPGALQFDLVIFDEASQVKPVDAMGAILRGKQTVVVGDRQQLPPTNFFDSLTGDMNEEEDDSSVGDMESILSLFSGKGAPERMLRWHYRSRDESLITISNSEFYHNRLVVFPNSGSHPQARGLRFHHLPHTAYDRGKTRTNPKEAHAVAQAIMDHARTFPDLSLGVAAFSVAQREAIEMQLELLRRQDATCEAFFSETCLEPFFVKNLENVQGDERDVIFISIGYGKTAEGYFPMSFGPLNREGGERRLNVLISRARLAMDVFSNFTADDIDTTRASGRGVEALKKFLNYAQHRRLDIPHSTGREPDSPFEESVIKALQEQGVEIEAQVGTAGFFIDIAVRDPAYPGRYMLGIECDGASYHSARSARDRDRLRQQILENQGWRLHRIWSTNWYRNPQEELEKALAAIEQAKTLTTSPVTGPHGNGASGGLTEPIIERSVETSYPDDWVQPSNLYDRAKVTIPLNNRALHEIPVAELVPFVQSVVHIESPVHPSVIIQRVTEGAGLKRAGNRIQDIVGRAIQQAVKGGFICQRSDFLWVNGMERPLVRDRSLLDAAERKLEYIAPEELEESLLQEIGASFSLVKDEAIQNSARRLGISRVTDQTKQLMTKRIDQLVDSGRLNVHEARICLK